MKSGFKVIEPKEGDEEVRLTSMTERGIENAIILIRVLLESGSTKILIVEEDRAIRDGRRSMGLDPNVEIEGDIGWRHCKQSTPNTVVQPHSQE
jgi:hypothetical protein